MPTNFNYHDRLGNIDRINALVKEHAPIYQHNSFAGFIEAGFGLLTHSGKQPPKVKAYNLNTAVKLYAEIVPLLQSAEKKVHFTNLTKNLVMLYIADRTHKRKTEKSSFFRPKKIVSKFFGGFSRKKKIDAALDFQSTLFNRKTRSPNADDKPYKQGQLGKIYSLYNQYMS